MVRHIPTITLKSESQPIWYDSECHRKCKEKERYHKKYKRTGSLHDGLKFTTARKEFKKLVSQKMRAGEDEGRRVEDEGGRGEGEIGRGEDENGTGEEEYGMGF